MLHTTPFSVLSCHGVEHYSFPRHLHSMGFYTDFLILIRLLSLLFGTLPAHNTPMQEYYSLWRYPGVLLPATLSDIIPLGYYHLYVLQLEPFLHQFVSQFPHCPMVCTSQMCQKFNSNGMSRSQCVYDIIQIL